MKRELCTALSVAIILSAFLNSSTTAVNAENSDTQVSAKAAVLYEPHTKTFVYSKKADERLPMASTTKIMTALVAVENANDLEEVITVPDDAVGVEGSSVYLNYGSNISIKDLLYSLLLQSANDAAAALAIHIGGSINDFACLMNERAASIGAENTHFTNPHGLDDDDHYTTAKDLALITAEALENPILRSIFSTYKYSFFIDDAPRTVVNHNKLLKTYEYATGVKTGYTRRSGRCLVSSAEKDGLSLIAVTLDAPNDWSDHKKLLDLGFDSFQCYDPTLLSQVCFELPVIGGAYDHLAARAVLDDVKLIVSNTGKAPSARVELKPYVVAPICEGDVVGEIIYFLDGTELSRAKIIACESIDKFKKRNLFDFFKEKLLNE